MVSSATRKAIDKYEKEKLFKTLVRFKKEDEKRIRAVCGKSLNGFIVSAVLEKVEKLEKLEQGEQCEPTAPTQTTKKELTTEKTPETAGKYAAFEKMIAERQAEMQKLRK